MVRFNNVTLEDKAWVDALVMTENCPSADFNFGNIYIWDTHYRQGICRLGDRMLTAVTKGGCLRFVYPVGSGSLAPAIEAYREYAAARSQELVIMGVTEPQRERLETEYPNRFDYREDTEHGDYIYSAEKLSTYSGKSLHAKKNHCNRFEAEHDWSFRELTPELIPACAAMLDEWTLDNSDRLDKSIILEHEAILRAFNNLDALALEGGVLCADGELIGFSLGELSCADTFDVHFEKARADINGAYTMVCRELTRMVSAKHPELRYMNREDDMGLEPLKKSKLSYKPEYILKKYTARWKND